VFGLYSLERNRMTDNNHPITPPPELVEQWCYEDGDEIMTSPRWYQRLCAKSARWGADQELEACCEWLDDFLWVVQPNHQVHPMVPKGAQLRAARRPEPPSLKEQAKFAAAVLRSPDETCSIAELQQHWHTICNALEQLDD
jgi:hypothetical protein